jgi:NAD-dependent dihydropyrimidine dehydrogenase PreA subunit
MLFSKIILLMSLLLSDKVWIMLSEVAKRGIYPTHAGKLGIYRLPVDITGQTEINSIMNDLKSSGFALDTFADRIFITYKWTEKGFDIYTKKEQSANLDITVEIVTGEVTDLLYQIKSLEQFGDFYWIKDYKFKADHYAKIIIDTIIRNTKVGQKLINYYQKMQKLSVEESQKKLEELTPFANALKQMKGDGKQTGTSKLSSLVPPTDTSANKSDFNKITNVPPSPPKPSETIAATAAPVPTALSMDTSISLTGSGTSHSAAEGPIDVGFKSKRQPVGKFKGIEVWGPYDAPGQLGIWGTDVCVDFDICISDGACIDACPVNVYEWLDTPGHPASEKKPFMIREKDCIFCLACENVCPPQAIKIFSK